MKRHTVLSAAPGRVQPANAMCFLSHLVFLAIDRIAKPLRRRSRL